MMLEVNEIEINGYEKVIEAIDTVAGLHSIIAVHNTDLGPSVGGTRIYPYNSKEDALEDALRLSRGMTYKSAVAGIGLGGGKSVIIADPHTQKTDELLEAFGQAVDSLQGKYICAEDVGSTPQDMEIISRCTPYVAAMTSGQSSGDPSPYTAWGCFRGIQAVAESLWNTTNLRNRTIAIQGLGSVGAKLAEFLYWQGVRLLVTDIDEDKIAYAERHFGAERIDPGEFCTSECDILAPCALGGTINSTSIQQLRCRAVAGSANNQLEEPDLGDQLHRKGILYAPDYVINSGGIINASFEFEPEGYDPRKAVIKVDNIYDTLRTIFEVAYEMGSSPHIVADEIAESKISCSVGKRQTAVRLEKRA
ncbi:Leucine dehydrogenase [Chlamydiales bacterium SCGC AG-110-P3]|nr:Leucine dehydrogenase [Chlamydiales bacterium SCGC AG-110-P3]